MRICSWRDCQAWAAEGLPLGTVSNEAAKLYDACLTQVTYPLWMEFVAWYDEPEVGGLVNSMQRMFEADPDFSRVFNFGMQTMGTLESIESNKNLRLEYETLESLLETKKDFWTQREYQHTKAALLFAEGKCYVAANLWEEIILECPTDIHAIKMASLAHFYLGNAQQLRDSPARVLPFWEAKRPPLKSFLYGLYAFGLEETGQYQKAEHFARKALCEESRDGWATHSLAHVFEMNGRTNEGIQYMTSTAQYWEQSNFMACHNYWHLALFHLENEEYEAALRILEEEILQRGPKGRTMLDIADVTSLLFRFDILNPSSLKPSHWEKALDLTEPYSKQRISTFNDMHFMMGYAGCRKQDLIEDVLETSCSTKLGELANHPTVRMPLLQAIADFKQERYKTVVETLYPIRNEVHKIGGSYAQIDILNLMLIIACLKSETKINTKRAKVLIHEREAGKSTLLGHRLLNWCDTSLNKSEY